MATKKIGYNEGDAVLQLKEKSIYDLELGECTCVRTPDMMKGQSWYERVPGGWIIHNITTEHPYAVFVPYHTEFKGKG